MSKSKVSSRFSVKDFYNKYGTAMILLVIVVASYIGIPVFRSMQNSINVLLQINVVTILAIGATFVIILGHINVAYGSLLAFIGCFSAIIMVQTNSMFLAVAAGILLGLIIGIINGVVITYLRIPAFIMTLAVTTIARGGALLITGGKNITKLGNYKVIGQGDLFGVPIPVIILIVLFGICWVLLNKTPFGRRIYAVGGNEKAAIASGIKSKMIVIYAFMLDGVCAAIAAIVFVSRTNSGVPSAGEKYEFDAITAVVVGGTSLSGGTGTLVGTIIGALIVGVINNIQNLLGIHTQWQKIVKGLIILIAVIVDVFTKKGNSKK